MLEKEGFQRNCIAYLVGGTALVGTKHNDVWGAVGELLGVEGLVVLEKLHVRTTALEAV
jgi:hypothetical protein